MIRTILISTLETLFETCVSFLLILLTPCNLSSAWIQSAAKTTPSSLIVLVVLLVLSATCINIMYWFLFWGRHCLTIGFTFIVRLCSIPFSRRIAYSYASCGVRVCANNSSAIFCGSCER